MPRCCRPKQIERLYAETRAVLTAATEGRRGVPPGELRAAKIAALRVHRQAPARPAGGAAGVIHEYPFSGAAAQYCPTCQTGGALLEA